MRPASRGAERKGDKDELSHVETSEALQAPVPAARRMLKSAIAGDARLRHHAPWRISEERIHAVMITRATLANLLNLASMSIGVALIGACGAAQSGATDANVATASANASEGARLFGQQCAHCHGQRGEGTSAPAIMGPGALPTYPRTSDLSTNPAYSDPSELKLREAARPAGAPKREPFNTAHDVYNYVSKNTPLKAAGSLKTEEYWAILNFMLTAHGVAMPQGGLSGANASSVAVTPK